MRKRTAFVLIVFLVFLTGWIRERAAGGAEHASPDFGPLPAPDFEQLRPPLGDEALRGRVVLPDGTPCADLEVVLSPPRSAQDDDTAAAPLHWAVTDASGEFRFEDLLAGDYAAVLMQPGREPVRRDVSVPTPGEVIWSLEDSEVPALEELPRVRRVDVVGRVESPERPSLLGKAQGPRDPTGFEVVLRPVNDDPMELTGVAKRRTTVAADGSFRFDRVVAGAYRLELLPPWARSGSWPVIDALELELDPTGSPAPRLTIRSGSVAGRLMDPEGRPIEGALVEAWPLDAPDQRWPVGGSRADGTFVVEDLPPGRYVIRVRAGDGTLERTVEVQEGAARTLELEPLDPHG